MSQNGCDFNQIISKSFERTIGILFKPFSLKKWLFLLFIAWLAGALGSGGGCNMSGFKPEEKAEAYPVKEPQKIFQKDLEGITPPQADSISGDHDNTNNPVTDKEGTSSLSESPMPAETVEGTVTKSEGAFGLDRRSRWIFGVLGVLAVLLSLPIMLLFAWISARFRFIWYEAILHNDAAIIAPFEKYKHEGNSLFFGFLLCGVIWWGLFLSVGLWAYFSARLSGVFGSGFVWSVGLFFKLFGVPLLIAFFWMLAGLLVWFLIDHFLVPIMAFDRLRFRGGIARFLKIYKDHQKDFWLFVLLSMGLGILSGLLGFLLVMFIMLMVGLSGVILFGVLYLLVAVLLKLKVVFIILAVILGIPFFATVLLVLIGTALPFAVFYRNLSLYFISSLNCGYDILPLEDDRASEQAA